MPNRYPEIKWKVSPEGEHMFKSEDFTLRCRLRTGGPSAGSWAAIMNAMSLTLGNGEFGYEFTSEEHAKSSLKEAMHELIDKRIMKARRTLEMYT